MDSSYTNLISILNLPQKEIEKIHRKGSKVFVETKNNPKGRYGGYSHYFWNLAHGRYKFNHNDKEQGSGGPRTLQFLVKYISVTDRILSHKRPIRILDIGCSSGFLRKFLESNVFKTEEVYYYGIDIRKHILREAAFDKEYIESGAEGDNIKSLYINWDVRNGLPFKKNSFDFVVSFEMIKYLLKKDVKKLYKEINRILRGDGQFIYSTAGIGSTIEQRNRLRKRWKDRMSSFWYLDELKKELKKDGFYVMKIYGSESSYDAIKNSLKEEDKISFMKMDSIYPKELMTAIWGPLYPATTHIRLFILSKSQPDLLSEVKREFPGEKVEEVKHRGNSKIFSVNDKVVKYMPKYLLGKNLEVYKLLEKQTTINLPQILDIRESKISDNYLVVMSNQGETLFRVWPDLKEGEKIKVVEEVVRILKEMHNIRFNPRRIFGSIHFLGIGDTWEKRIYTFCKSTLDSFYEKRKIHSRLYKDLLNILGEGRSFLTNYTPDFSLLSCDMNENNLTINKENLNMSLLFDFETFTMGDRYLDVVITSTFFANDKYRRLFLNLYGIPNNFDSIANIYRLVLIILFLTNKDIEKDKENDVVKFIKGQIPFYSLSFIKD